MIIKAVFAPHNWPAYMLGALTWLAAAYIGWWWWWVPVQPFEVYLSAPVPVNPQTELERHRWARGDTFGVLFDTQILRDCPATYERWLRRADGLTYGPSRLGGSHSGHYTQAAKPGGQQFISLIDLPADIRPGDYAYVVRVTAHCSPFRPTVEESPPVLIEVR